MGKKPPRLPRGVSGYPIGRRGGGRKPPKKGCAVILLFILAVGTLTVAGVWRLVA